MIKYRVGNKPWFLKSNIRVQNKQVSVNCFTVARPKSLVTQELIDVLNPFPLFEPPSTLYLLSKHNEPFHATPITKGPPSFAQVHGELSTYLKKTVPT